MAAQTPRRFYVITNRGELGPFDRIELSEAVRNGAARSDERVRNAFGRQLGTVGDVLSGAASGRTSASGLSPVAEPAPRRSAGRSPVPWLVGSVIAALVLLAVFVGTSTDESASPPRPVPPAPPVASKDSPGAVPPPPVTPKAGTTLPEGWTVIELGDARPKGKAELVEGVWRITGGGSDIWGGRDECHWVYRKPPPAFTATVRVVSMEATDEWDRAGIMLRDDEDPAAAMAAIIVTHGGKIQFIYREQIANDSLSVDAPATSFPVWLRLQRRGTMISAWWSGDGSDWHQLGEHLQIPSLGDATQVGLAVCSHNRSIANQVVFDRLDIAPLP